MQYYLVSGSYPGQGPYLYKMKTQAFPKDGHPGALVYVPSSYNVSSGWEPLNLVVYVHGWRNCISNCVLDVGQGTNCTAGQPARNSYSLIKQIEAAQIPALLLLPEVKYDEPNSDPGQLGDAGGWYDFMAELLSLLVSDKILPPSMEDVASINRIVVFSHSGAYDVTAAIASVGGVAQVKGIVMLDSLYADFDQFNTWIAQNAANNSFGTTNSTEYMWGNVYTDHGGTYDNSVVQANTTLTFLEASSQQSLMLWDNTYSTLPASDYTTFPIIFKRSELAHDDVPVYYIQQFIQASPWGGVGARFGQ